MAANTQKITLKFEADTSAAQHSIEALNSSLNSIQRRNNATAGLDLELKKAAEAANVLQQSLQKAVNVDTGRINFTTFSNSLKAANTNLQQVVSSLSAMGTVGQSAVNQLATSLATAQIPVKKMTGMIASFGTTLKNTMKWQMASNIVHGMEGAMKNALSYAQNLNKTLTSIQQVSGASFSDMQKFTVQANQAAKVLATTTKAYADASLIYYQQGDSAELAAKKAEITLKATNSAFKANAQEMSEMLTATWNAYQVGADKLEHYVDVMANLGANTATSLEEIATALQKVASTANVVGVPMEKMSAMIATISSATRQAASTVGTAMNTILNRMSSLKLGETLEDGVDLTKYTKALSTIGVSVLDATGELRDMGTVIEEVGNKWSTLSTAQQSALAQTIGGVRQYTNLMSLFSNWDKYQKNLNLANNSNGQLNRMQDIYAKSWEGATKRTKAAVEGIYETIIDDKFMIDFQNSIAKVTELVNDLVKGFGGLPGILSRVGMALSSAFSDKITAGVANMLTGIGSFASYAKSNGVGTTIKQMLMGTMPNREQRQQANDLGILAKTMVGSAATNAGTTQGALYAKQARLLTQQQQYLLGNKQGQTGNINQLSTLNQAQITKVGAAIQAGEDYNRFLNIGENGEGGVLNLVREAADSGAALGYISRHGAQNLNQLIGFANIAAGDNRVATEADIRFSEIYSHLMAQNAETARNSLGGISHSASTGQMRNAATTALNMFKEAGIVNDFTNKYAGININNLSKAELEQMSIDAANLDKDAVYQTLLSDRRDRYNDSISSNGLSTAEHRQLSRMRGSAAELARLNSLKTGMAADALNPEQQDMTKWEKISQSISQNAPKAAAGMMSLVMGINQAQSVINAFQSDNLTQQFTAIVGAVQGAAQSLAQGGIFGLAMYGASMVITGIINIIEDDKKRAIEAAKVTDAAIARTTEDISKRSKTVLEADNSLSSLSSQYEEGTITQQEYTSSLLQVAESLGIQNAAVLNLQGGYQALTQAIEETITTQEQYAANQARQAYNNAVNQTEAIWKAKGEESAFASNRRGRNDSGGYYLVNVLDNGHMRSDFTYNGVKYESGGSNSIDSNLKEQIFDYLGLDITEYDTHDTNHFLASLLGGKTGSGYLGGGEDDLILGNSMEDLIQMTQRMTRIREAAEELGSTTLLGSYFNNLIGRSGFQNTLAYLQSVTGDASNLRDVMWQTSGQTWLKEQNISTYNYNATQRSELISGLLTLWGIDEETASQEIIDHATEIAASITKNYVSGLEQGGSQVATEVEQQSNNYKKAVQQAKKLGVNLTNLPSENSAIWNYTSSGALFKNGTNITDEFTNQLALRQQILTSRNAVSASNNFSNANFNALESLRSLYLTGINAGFDFGGNMDQIANLDKEAQVILYNKLIQHLKEKYLDDESIQDEYTKGQVSFGKIINQAMTSYMGDLLENPFIIGTNVNKIEDKLGLKLFKSSDLSQQIADLDTVYQEITAAPEGTYNSDFIEKVIQAHEAISSLQGLVIGDPFEPLAVSSQQIMSNIQTIQNMKLDPSKWGSDELENMIQILQAMGISLTEWLDMSDIEKQKAQLTLLKAQLEELKNSADASKNQTEIELLSNQIDTLDKSIVDTEFDAMVESLDTVTEKWQEMGESAETALSLIKNNITNFDDMSFEDFESLRQSLLQAGLEGEKVAEILNKIKEAGSGDKKTEEQIWAGVTAATQAALVAMTSYDQQLSQYEDLASQDIIKQIEASEAKVKVTPYVPEGTVIENVPDSESKTSFNADGSTLAEPPASESQTSYSGDGSTLEAAPPSESQTSYNGLSSTLASAPPSESQTSYKGDGSTLENAPPSQSQTSYKGNASTLAPAPESQSQTSYSGDGSTLEAAPPSESQTSYNGDASTLAEPPASQSKTSFDTTGQVINNVPNSVSQTTLDAENKPVIHLPTGTSISVILDAFKERGANGEELTALEQELKRIADDQNLTTQPITLTYQYDQNNSQVLTTITAEIDGIPGNIQLTYVEPINSDILDQYTAKAEKQIQITYVDENGNPISTENNNPISAEKAEAQSLYGRPDLRQMGWRAQIQSSAESINQIIDDYDLRNNTLADLSADRDLYQGMSYLARAHNLGIDIGLGGNFNFKEVIAQVVEDWNDIKNHPENYDLKTSPNPDATHFIGAEQQLSNVVPGIHYAIANDTYPYPLNELEVDDYERDFAIQWLAIQNAHWKDSKNAGEIDDSIIRDQATALFEAYAAVFQADVGEYSQLAGWLLTGLSAGLEEAGVAMDWTSILDSMNLAADIRAAFEAVLLIHSPSKLTMALAPFLVEGLSVGLQEAIAAWEPSQDVQGLGEKIQSAFMQELKGLDLSATWINAYNDAIEKTDDESLARQMADDAVTNMVDTQSEDFFNRIFKNEGYKTVSWLSDGQKNALSKALTNVLGSKSIKDITYEEYLQVKDKIDEEYTKLINLSKTTANKIKDIWHDAFSNLFDLDTSKAEKVYNRYLEMFNNLRTARQGLLNGKSLAETFASDIEGLGDVLQQAGLHGRSPQELLAYISNPDLDVFSLQYQQYNPSMAKKGANTFFNYDESSGFITDTTYAQYQANAMAAMQEVFADEGRRRTGYNALVDSLNLLGPDSLSMLVENLYATPEEQTNALTALSQLLPTQNGTYLKKSDNENISLDDFNKLMSALFGSDVLNNIIGDNMYSEDEFDTAYWNTVAEQLIGSYQSQEQAVKDYADALGYTKEQFKELRNELNQSVNTDDTDYLNKLTYEVANYKQGLEEMRKISASTWKQMTKDIANETDTGRQNIQTLKDSMAKIFNTDATKITTKFVTDHLKQLKKMSTGTEKEAKAAEEVIRDDLVASIIEADNTIKDHPLTVDVDADGVKEQFSGITDFFQNAFDQWDGEELGFTIKADTNEAQANVINTLNNLLAAGEMTATGITQALNSIGWQPDIEYDEYDIVSEDPVAGTITYEVPGIDGSLRAVTGQASGLVTSNGKVKVPRIGSGGITKIGGGGNNKPSSSGGGGGGGKKKKDRKTDADKERYHQVDRRISTQNKLLEQNDKLKSRKYGDSYIKNLEKENSLIKKQIDLNKQKIDEARQYLAKDRGELEYYGATFDEEGNVNYDAYMNKWISWYNAQADAFEAGGIDDDAWDDIEKRWDKAMKALENYEEAQDVILDGENEILELQNEISENLKDAATYKMTITVELSERELKLLEHYISRYEDSLTKQADIFSYMGDQMEQYSKQAESAGDAISKLFASAGMILPTNANGLPSPESIGQMIGTFTSVDGMLNNSEISVANFEEGLEDIYDQLLDSIDQMVELRKNMLTFYDDVLTLGEDKLSKFTNTLKYHIDVMNKYKEILNYISDGTHFKETDQVLKSTYESSLAQVQVMREQVDTYREQRENIIGQLANQPENEFLQQQLEDINESIEQTEEDLMSTAQETMDVVKEIYENAIEELIYDLERLGSTTGDSLDELKQKWDWWVEEQDLFVDRVTQAYEIDKLTRKIEQSIADDRQISHQAELKALNDEIIARSKANALSEYDIKMMEYSYELLLARQSLEDARNAKSTVRLTRDENGNMIYQYTADQDAIAEAQQHYNDVLYQMNQTTEERYRDLASKLTTVRKEHLDALKALEEDQTLTDEEYMRKKEEINAHYYAIEEALCAQLEIVDSNMVANQVAMSRALGQNLTDSTTETRNQINRVYNSMVADQADWERNVEIYVAKSNAAHETYKNTLTAVADAAGVSWDQMSERITEFTAETEKARQKSTEIISQLAKELTAVNNQAVAWNKLDQELRNAVSYYEQLATRINETTAALSRLSNAASGAASTQISVDYSGYTSRSSGSGGSGGGGSGGSGSSSGSSGKTYTAEVTGYKGSGASETVTGTGKSKEEAQTNAYKKFSSNIQRTDPTKYYKKGGLNTYTGPAWLDGTMQEPEYVLNAQQTEQMFGILSSNTITNLIDTMRAATVSMLASLGFNTPYGSIMHNNSNEMNQNVEITANFPSATDHNEIQMALEGLINKASQFANRLQR